MTNPTRLTKGPAGAAIRWAKIVLPAAVVLAVAVAGARIKGWPILPFVQGGGPKYDASDWCGEHGVPESLCTLCHPELGEKLLTCFEHGVPEAMCTLCRPELAERLATCREHGLPESYCPICHPPEAGAAAKPDWCAEHGVPESKCPLCNQELESPLCPEHQVPESLCTACRPELAEQIPTCSRHDLPPTFCRACKESSARYAPGDGPALGMRSPLLLPKGPASAGLCRLDLPAVRLASVQSVLDAGIEVAPVETRSLDRKVTCNAAADYQGNRYVTIRPRVEGIVREILVDVGAEVRRGDVLAIVDSAALGEAKADYLGAVALLDLAQKNLERLVQLDASQIVPGKTLIEAETRLSEGRAGAARAQQRLQNLGLSLSQIEELRKAQDTSSLLPVGAPWDGIVVRRQVAPGEAVEATSPLFAVADLSRMWVHLNVYETDSHKVREGQPITFLVESMASRAFHGRVTWISTEVNARTRTIQVRAEVENPNGLLRAGMYGTALIQIEAPVQTPVVPRLAVQWHGGRPVVFVKKGEDLFEPRRVSLGDKDGPFWEVTAGLKPSELVATAGSFLLKTELEKGALGASCSGE